MPKLSVACRRARHRAQRGRGLGRHTYEYQQILTGIRRNDDRIDPIPPMLRRDDYGIEFIATEVLVGRRLFGPLHVKGGFTWGLTGDVHPFQPLILLAWKR